MPCAPGRSIRPAVGGNVAHNRLDDPDMTAPVPAAGETAAGTSRVPLQCPRPASRPGATSGQSWTDDVDNARSPILAGFLGSWP